MFNLIIKKIFSYIILLTGILMAYSCSENNTPVNNKGNEKIEGIYVNMAQDRNTKTRDVEEDEDYFDDEAETVFDVNFDERSILYISQRTDRSYPFLSEDAVFAYSYNKEAVANWDEGYNFFAYDFEHPLDWDKIGQIGMNDNHYSFFALYYPLGDGITTDDATGSFTMKYGVSYDQTELDDLKRSDILGASHNALNNNERLRFKLFHLMDYVKITLYVPVYNNEKKTGFGSDAMESSIVEGVYPDFYIEYGQGTNPDECPNISLIDQDVTPVNINCYEHPADHSKTKEIKIGDFLPSNYPYDQGVGAYDNVRVYNYSVIIPPQRLNTSNDNNTLGFKFRFNLRAPSGIQNTYIFDGTQYSISAGNQLNLKTSGVLQHIKLYVPRVGLKPIIISAQIDDWKDFYSDLPLLGNDVDD